MRYHLYDPNTRIYAGTLSSASKPLNSTQTVPPPEETYHDTMWNDETQRWELVLRDGEEERYARLLKERANETVEEYEVYSKQTGKFEVDSKLKAEKEADSELDNAKGELTLELLAEAILTGDTSLLQTKVQTIEAKKQAKEAVITPIGGIGKK